VFAVFVRRAGGARRPHRWRQLAALLVIAGSFVIGTAHPAVAWEIGVAVPSASALPSRRPYLHPVDAAVIEPFTAVDQPYAAGNRGLDYGVSPGTVVRAAGAGRVVFAGPVAGRNFVTVAHPDGIRTSYSYLATIEVRVGRSVHAGDRLGTTTAEFQLGMRRGSRYIDPAPLLGRAMVRHSRLTVPIDSRPRGDSS
jgi:murein DD-endopeptidase MepM/ murein hydrolase activator NlpD